MATATPPPISQSEAEDRLLLTNIRWETYEALLADLADCRGIRLTYDRGMLEIMSPSLRHDRYDRLLGRVIDIITEELEISSCGGRSTTFRKEDSKKGLEPDECYWIRHAHLFWKKFELDLSIDPPPDLAVEIEVSRSILDRLGIYAELRVPELWRFDGRRIQVLALQDDGTYAESLSSLSFPFLPLDEIVQVVMTMDTPDETQWARTVRAWVRAELLPRYQRAQAENAGAE